MQRVGSTDGQANHAANNSQASMMGVQDSNPRLSYIPHVAAETYQHLSHRNLASSLQLDCLIE